MHFGSEVDSAVLVTKYNDELTCELDIKVQVDFILYPIPKIARATRQ